MITLVERCMRCIDKVALPTTVGAVFGLLLIACRGGLTPPLPFMVHRFTAHELMERSDLIVAARVASTDIYGTPRRLEDGLWTIPWRVQIDVGSALKGSAEGRLTYFLNNFTLGPVQNGSLERLWAGNFRIIFLTYKQSILRAVSDAYSTSLLLRQDFPPLVIAESNAAPLAEKIATILLVPPARAHVQEYSANFSDRTAKAIQFAGYHFVASLLTNLENSESADLREQACLAMFEELYANDAGVRQLEAKGVTYELSGRIKIARTNRQKLETAIRDALHAGQECPLARVYGYGVDVRDPQSISALLEFAAANPDPLLRACAQQEMDKLRSR